MQLPQILRRKFKKPEYLNAVRKYHKENLNFLKRPVLMRHTGVLLAPLTKDHLSDPLYAHTIPPLSDLTTTRRGGRRALFQTQSRFKVIKQGKRDRRSNYDICRELDSQNCPTPVTWECKRWTFAYKNDPKLRLRIHKMFHKA